MGGSRVDGSIVRHWRVRFRVLDAGPEARPPGVGVVDLGVRFPIRASVHEITPELCRAVGIDACDTYLWLGSQRLDGSLPAGDLPSGEVLDLLDCAVVRRPAVPLTAIDELRTGQPAGPGAGVAIDGKQLDVIHGPGAGRSVFLTSTSVDLVPFLGPGSGSICRRDHVVIWKWGGRMTVLEEGVPYRMGPGLSIVRPWLPPSVAGDGVVHRLPVFERRVAEHVLGPLRPPDTGDGGRQLPTVAVAVPLAGGVVGAMVFGRPEFLILSAMAPIASLATWSSERSRSRKRQRIEGERFDRDIANLVAEGASIGAEMSRLAHESDPDLAALYRRVLAGDGRLWDRDLADTMSFRIGTAPGRIPIVIGVEAAAAAATADDAFAQLRNSVETVSDLPACAELAIGPTGDTGGGRAGDTGGGRAGATGGLAIVGPEPLLGDVTRAVLAQLACRYPPSQLRIDVPDDARLNGTRWLPHALARGSGSVDARRCVRVAIDAPDRPVPQQRPLDPTIWLSGDPRRIPRWCDTVVTLEGYDDQAPGAAAALVRTRSGDRRIEPDRLDADRFDDLGRVMARLREAATGGDRGDDGLLEALEVTDASAMRRHWSADGGRQRDSLLVTVGVGEDGPVRFDLVADGPHALIAGTTGSGKSMLLQTALLSLAATHAPGRVQFLGIDFKGGATFDPLRTVPHCAGVVTNLDGALAERVLVSLRAELGRRMGLLSGRAADLAALRAMDPDGAPPSLVIVIDEFAALVREAPGFLDAMVDLAQRGRSLGLHLILATQRPTGAVNDAILANTNIRVAMRCADGAESVAIIGDRGAADLVRPGRGLVKLGAAAPVPFRVPDGDRRVGSTIAVTTWSLGGPEPAVGHSGQDGPGDRQRLLTIIEDAAAGMERGTRPWLDPLPDDLVWSHLEDLAPGAAGVIDRPERQDAVALEPPASGVLVICGARGSGRSNGVVAAVRSRRAAHPGITRVHVVDWSGRSPVPGSVEPDVVVGPAQIEPLIRLIQLFELRIDRHRHGGGGDDAGGDAGLVIVAVDEIGQVVEELQSIDHGQWISVLARVMREGPRCGVLFVVSALRWRDLPGALHPAVTTVWQLRPSHVDDVAGLALPGGDTGTLLGSAARLAATSSMPPGRTIVDGHWAQIARVERATPGSDPSAPLPSWPGPPCLPESWPLVSTENPSPEAIVIGLCDLTFGLLVTQPTGHVAVVGPSGSGRTNALEVLARQWPIGRRVLLAGPTNRLHGLGCWDRHFGFDDAELPALLRQALAVGDEIVMVVDDVDELPEAAMAVLDIAAGDRRVTFLVAGPAARLERAFAGWLAEVKRSGRFLVLQPDRAGDVEQLTGRRVRLRPDEPMVPGRGVWVDRRRTTLVQMPLARALP